MQNAQLFLVFSIDFNALKQKNHQCSGQEQIEQQVGIADKQT